MDPKGIRQIAKDAINKANIALQAADRLEAQHSSRRDPTCDDYCQYYENLPELQDLPIGQGGWVTSWTMFADETGRLYLNPESTYESAPAGTVDLYIERWEDGYHVWTAKVYSGHREWLPQPHSVGLAIPVRARHKDNMCGTRNLGRHVCPHVEWFD